MDIRAQFRDYYDDRLAVWIRTPDKRIIKPFQYVMAEYEEGDYGEPTFFLSADEAQQMMNELWRCGIRPKDGEGSDAQVNALTKHLSDMKTIAFHALKIKG